MWARTAKARKMMTGIGTWPKMRALAPPDEVRLEAADRAAGGEEQRRAAEDRHAAERHHEGRHLQPGDGEALEIAAGEPDRDRRQRRERTSRSRCACPRRR